MLGWLKAVGIGNPWSIAPWMIGLAAVFFLGTWFDADSRQRRVEKAVVSDFGRYALYRAIESHADKKLLVEQLRDERASLANWMARFDRIMEASDAERATFRADLAVSYSRQKQLAEDANEKARLLDAAESILAKSWNDGSIPADINCGVFKSAGCAELPKPAAPSAGGSGGGLPGVTGRDAAAAAGSAVPAQSANRPTNGGGPQQ